jgi:hypothetical protein
MCASVADRTLLVRGFSLERAVPPVGLVPARLLSSGCLTHKVKCVHSNKPATWSGNRIIVQSKSSRNCLNTSYFGLFGANLLGEGAAVLARVSSASLAATENDEEHLELRKHGRETPALEAPVTANDRANFLCGPCG